VFFVVAIPLILVELAGPLSAERGKGGTPWNARHIAERYGLLAIITLGEGVIGTVASLSAVLETQGWSRDAALIAVAGTGLTFGMWWMYFVVPSAEVLSVRRDRGLPWGYAHIPVFGAIAATGAGLHVAADYLGDEAHIGTAAVVLTVTVPVATFVVAISALYAYLAGAFGFFPFWLLGGTAAVLGLAVLLAVAGVPMATCLVVVMAAPLVVVVGYEVAGHRHMAVALERAVSR